MSSGVSTRATSIRLGGCAARSANLLRQKSRMRWPHMSTASGGSPSSHQQCGKRHPHSHATGTASTAAGIASTAQDA